MEELKIEVGNFFFLLFLLYVIFVMGTEYCYFITGIIGKEIPVGIVEAFFSFVVVVVIFLLRSKIAIRYIKPSPELIFVSLFLLVFGLVLSIYPDTNFDTLNYHLISQNPHFENYFVKDYAYGYHVSWGFRLADRMFYYFRALFGYRLGTVLNAIIFALSYIQLHEILLVIRRYTGCQNKSFINPFIWGVLILYTKDAIEMLGTYLVDTVSLPIVFELIYRLIQDKKVKPCDVVFYSFLSGLCIGLKLTNIIYVIPCMLLFVARHFHNIHFKEWIICFFCGMIPYLEYLMHNLICTGNPIFPYCNNIFKSAYYPIINRKDIRWGPTNTLEKMFWPLFAVFKPYYRQGEIYEKAAGLLAVGIVIAVLATFVIFKMHLKGNWNKLAFTSYMVILIIAVTSTYLWVITTGYGRYFTIGKMIWGVLSYYGVAIIISNYPKTGSLIAIMSMFSLCVCTSINMRTLLIEGWNYRFTKLSWGTFKEQIHNVFIDNDIYSDYGIKPDVFVHTDLVTQGIAELLNDDAYNICALYPDIDIIDKNILIHSKVADASLACSIHSRNFSDATKYIKSLNDYGLIIDFIGGCTLGPGDYELFALSNAEKDANTIWTSGTNQNLVIQTDGMKGAVVLEMTVGTYYNLSKGEDWRVIVATNSKDDNEIITIKIEGINKHTIPLELDESTETISIYAVDSDGERLMGDNKVFVLNAKLW